MTRMKTQGARARRRPTRSHATIILRARVANAFRELAHGAVPEVSQNRSLGFYRSSGMTWVQRFG